MPARSSRPSAPGWYGDPRDPAVRRYWDGHAWTSHVATSGSRRTGEGWRYAGPTPGITHQLVVAGWIAALLLPPVGVAIGIRLVRSYEHAQGIAMIAISIVMLIVFVAAFAG